MKLNIRELLEYFDVKEATDYGDTTATISVVGEDLGAALFKHYYENKNKSKITIVDPNDAIPTQGIRKGKHLDRWIISDKDGKRVLYQTEIKSWCSRAIGGVTTPVEIDDQRLLDVIQKNWSPYTKILNDAQINGSNKVLQEMPTDTKLKIEGKYTKEPLLILWDARSPRKDMECFGLYHMANSTHHYDHCYIFSCSLYLRSLFRNGIRDVSVEMPNAERRLRDLSRIFKIL